jgi:predicted ribosomally synthesized peptide with SipW-like signal peptide
MGLMLFGGVAALVGGTLANFTAQTTNASNTFSSGTLVLSDQKVGGLTCLSTGSGTNTDTNVNSVGCDNLINAGAQKPGGAVANSQVIIKNVGSVSASTLQLWSTACSSSNASGEAYHGTGNLCTVVNVTIHDDTNNFCYYPTAGAGACTMTSGKNLANLVATYPAASPLSLSTTGLNSGITYTIGTQMDSSAGNNMQGLAAAIDFNWKITQ